MICIIPFGSPQFDEAIRLRDEILRQPLKLKFHPEDIALEYDSFHFGYYNEHWTLLGCLTMKPLETHSIKMRQVATSINYQSKGIGTQLVKHVEFWARSNGYQWIVLHARDEAVGFYEKLGYLKVGVPFKEVGIQHFKMEKSLTS